jgi:hypothetical protein
VKRLLFSGFVVLNPVNGPAEKHPVFLLYAHNAFVTSLRKPFALTTPVAH